MIDDAIVEFAFSDGCVVVIRFADGVATALGLCRTGAHRYEAFPVAAVVDDVRDTPMRIARGRGLFRPSTRHERMQVLHAPREVHGILDLREHFKARRNRSMR